MRQRKLCGQSCGYKTELVGFASRPDFNLPEGCPEVDADGKPALVNERPLHRCCCPPRGVNQIYPTRRSTLEARAVMALSSGSVTLSVAAFLACEEEEGGSLAGGMCANLHKS